MGEPTGYGPDYYKSESELRAELAEAKAALTRTQDASLWWDQYNLEVRKHADTKAALAVKITSDEINAMPPHVRGYIAALETACDPNGTIRENYAMSEENRGLRTECNNLSAALEAANARIAELEGARWDGAVPPEEEIRQSKRMLFIQIKALQLSSNNNFARAERAEAESDSLRATIDNMRAMNIKLTFEETGKVLRAEAELAGAKSLLTDKTYIQCKADYNRGHLSHAGYLSERERATLNPSPAGEKS